MNLGALQGEENINFMPTILSRFDMIFIVKDEHNAERDIVSIVDKYFWWKGIIV